MPNAANGEALPLQSSVIKWASQSSFGTAAVPNTSAGIGLGGYRKLANPMRYRGPGSPNVVAVKQGSTYHEWQLQYEAVQSGIKTLLQKAVRSGGVLPFFTLGLGHEDDVAPTSNKSMQQIRDCLVNQLSLSWEAFQGVAALQASLSGPGTAAAELTNQAKALLTSTPWVSSEAVFTKDTVAYNVPRFSLDVAQNVSLDYTAPGEAPASFPNGPSFMTAHDEVIRGSLTRYQKIGVNVHATTAPEVDLLVILTNRDDSETLTLALSDVSFDNENEDHTRDGIRWSADFEAKTWSLA